MMGGPTGGRFAHTWDGTELEPVKYQSAFWAENNSCKSEPKIKKVNKNIEKWIYECPKQSPVKHIIIKDNGHAWPGGKKGTSIADEPSTSMNATDEIWKFFSSLI
jgi:polyhydroxybutyrate depolymerase